MVAGPPDMVEAMKEALAEVGVAEENVLAQGYSGY
jgi:NAD(P)H-flavin reductase